MDYDLVLAVVTFLGLLYIALMLSKLINEIGNERSERGVQNKELVNSIRGIGDEAVQRRMTALEIECKNANESRAELGAAVISMLERHSELPDDEDVKRLKDLVHFVD